MTRRGSDLSFLILVLGLQSCGTPEPREDTPPELSRREPAPIQPKPNSEAAPAPGLEPLAIRRALSLPGPTPSKMTPDFEGDQYRKVAFGEFVIRDRDSYERYFERHCTGAGVRGNRERNPVDFEREMVVYVAVTFPTLGWKVVIDSVWKTSDGILVRAKKIRPRGGVGQMVTYGTAAVVLDRSDLAVRFEVSSVVGE